MPKYNLNEEQRAKEIAFIMDANNWPLWPQLPVKRRVEGGSRHGLPECGTVNDRFLDMNGCEPALPLRVTRIDGEVLEYATAEAMLDDGWVVD